ncbi:uncharacterized protein GIQ15_01429 [Arthroderma uncinatum]|uniref:uncharacterized protein n=1 Tax=Arthroderma uncinatum TaxID=74035 RepID=UPI00144A956B|nr:uncharacterized protein GIQ15_01429 [Arthroderma uncinatum]KAF3491912.1 hypothetical protein GIQ15_01429 [Arthroderma uncinatum]
MAAPRSTSMRALRSLSQQPRRSLHITGAYSAQHATGPDVTTVYLSRTLADLRAECQKRNLGAAGSKSELVDRLSNHDVLQSRAFSIAMKRIDRHAFGQQPASRPFNTSRANRSPQDSSPIDLAYMPSLESSTGGQTMPRIPTPPDSYTHYDMAPSSADVMKPQIYTVSNDMGSNGPSPMSEVVDNHALDFNPFNLTEAVSRSRDGARASAAGQETLGGVVKDLWKGMLDDVKGTSRSISK